MYELYVTYTTQTEAAIFCRISSRAVFHRAGPGQYQVWVHI